MRTTLGSPMQALATDALRHGLMAYDRRDGWRGPLARLDVANGNWVSGLARVPVPLGALPDWRLSTVLSINERGAAIGFADATRGNIPWPELRWAWPWRERQRVGPEPKSPSDVLAPGDVVLVKSSITRARMRCARYQRSFSA